MGNNILAKNEQLHKFANTMLHPCPRRLGSRPSQRALVSTQIINWLPSPENSNPNTIFADQMLFEFLGEGFGGEGNPVGFRGFESSLAEKLYTRSTRGLTQNYCPSPPAPLPANSVNI
jgi:hypothetical protein